MLKAGTGVVWAGLGVVLFALASAVEAQGDQGLTAGAPHPPPSEAPCAGLQLQVEQLSQRLQGIEGKLKESAAARKSADQARMEAERRLAEGTQELGRLRAEVTLLEDAKLALEARLERAETQAETTAEALVAADQTVRELTAEDSAQTATSVFEDPAPERMEHRRPGDEASQGQLRRLKETQSDLRRSLSERESDLKRAQSELRAVKAERDALTHRLDALHLASPARQEVATTLEETQTRAAAAARSLREAMARLQDGRDPEARRALWEAGQDLRRWQLRAALLMGARTVYRVSPGDSLALIAERFYGDGRGGQEIQDANRLVVPDPSDLIPGTTLVIP
jgi:nucleoid-associated protein YgaU